MAKLLKQLGTGGVIGLVCMLGGLLIGGICVLLAGPIASIIYFVICAILFGLFWHYILGPAVLTNRLNEMGEDGEATIIAIAENGSSMQVGGTIPKAGMKITLQVQPKNGKPTYQAVINTFISMFEVQQYQPGAKVNVKIDPRDPAKIIITERTGAMESYSATIGSKE